MWLTCWSLTIILFSALRTTPASKLCSKEPSLLVPNDKLRHVWRLTVGGTIYNKGQTHTVFWMEDTHTVVTEDAWSMSPLPTPQQIWQKHQTGMLAKNQQDCMSVNQWFKTCANQYYKTHAETHTQTHLLICACTDMDKHRQTTIYKSMLWYYYMKLYHFALLCVRIYDTALGGPPIYTHHVHTYNMHVQYTM